MSGRKKSAGNPAGDVCGTSPTSLRSATSPGRGGFGLRFGTSPPPFGRSPSPDRGGFGVRMDAFKRLPQSPLLGEMPSAEGREVPQSPLLGEMSPAGDREVRPPLTGEVLVCASMLPGRKKAGVPARYASPERKGGIASASFLPFSYMRMISSLSRVRVFMPPMSSGATRSTFPCRSHSLARESCRL